MYTFKSDVNDKMRKMVLDCINKCNAINIPISKNIGFKTDSAERRNGYCHHIGKDDHIISISRLLSEDSEIENTIFHELLHTCPGCNNHGYKWQRYGWQIERAYGQRIQRLNNKKRVAVDITHSRRRYFSKEEWEANKDILQAYTREGEDRPIWFCKKGSKTAKELEFNCTSHGKKIVKFF